MKRALPLLVLLAACGTTPVPQVLLAPEEVPAPKVALVLGGGGARGFAHVGVLRVLEQEKISIGLIVGTSAGSLIGAMYADNPDAALLERVAFAINEADVLDLSLFSMATGPVKGDAIRGYVRSHTKHSNIEDLLIPFVAIAADLNTGERVELDKGPIEDAVRASVSIPGVFTPARIDGRTLVDGGIVSNLAVDVARARGADIIIAVNITESVHDDSVDHVLSIIVQAINIMMGQMAETQLRDADVVITPDLRGVGTLDLSQRQRCLDAGITATRGALPGLAEAFRAYYAQKGARPPGRYEPKL